MKSLFVLLFVLMMGSAVSAQDYITGSQSTNGRHTYNYYSDGTSSSTSQNGRFSYTYFSDGSRSTTTQIGNRSYTDIWLSPKPIQYAPMPIWSAPKPIRYDVDPRILWGNRAR